MSDTYHTVVKCARAIGPASDDGAVTRNRYTGDGATTWAAGQLVELASGVIAQTASGAQTVDTTDIAAGTVLFQATEAVAVATSEKVKVHRIKWNTIFEGPLLSSQSAQSAPVTAPESIIGTKYAIYQNAAGAWSVDKYVTSNPVVEIVDVEANFMPFKDPDLYVHSAADPQQYNFVRFRFLDSVISNE